MHNYLTGTLLWLIFGIAVARGNPVFVESRIEKAWERCLICVSKDAATVSCSVGYGFSEGNIVVPSNLEVLIPIVWSRRPGEDEKRFKESCDPRIEVGDQLVRLDRVTFTKDPSLPGELEVAVCRFTIRVQTPKSFSMVVSYTQPSYGGHTYYIPLFEGGHSPEMSDKFTISLFPAKGMKLKLASKHASKTTAMATRITIHPQHQELIDVITTPGG
ncbi:MAG: hypothetical protein ACRDBP_05875 [Luteolibacter sp.]